MDKKALRRIPRPALTSGQLQYIRRMPELKYLVTVQREEISGKDTLVLNFFHRNRDKSVIPEFRTFLQEGDFISQDLTAERTKWKAGAVDYLTADNYWSSIPLSIKVDTQDGHDLVTGWMREHTEGIMGLLSETDRDQDAIEIVERYCSMVKEDRLLERHRKQKAVIDEQMARFGDLPVDYQDFVEHEVFDEENFFFYSRKERRAYCTRCGKSYGLRGSTLFHNGRELHASFSTMEVKHNAVIRCPFCSAFVTAKSEGIPRGKLFFIAWSVLVQRDGADILVRYFRHTKDLRKDFRKAEYTTYEMFRTVHTAEKYMDYMWGRWKNTQEYRWTDFHMCHYWLWSDRGWNYPNSTMFYEKNLEEVLPGSCMQYSCLNEFIHRVARRDTNLNSPWCLDKYFNSFRKRPYIEQLIKVGMYRMVQDILERPEYADGLELKHGRTVCQSLGISRIQYKMLRRADRPTLDDLRVLKDAGEIPYEDWRYLCCIRRRSNDCYKRYIDMMKYTTVAKIRRYLEKYGITQDRDYFDYLGWIEEMGYDMGSSFNLFPAPFRKVHDAKAKEYLGFTSERQKEEARMFNEIIRHARENAADGDPSYLALEGLFIRPPFKLDELKHEGEVLHHCVGTYAEKVARGETMIFFIRRTEAPDTPYYTLEWKNGKIVQCRGMRNCGMTQEVKTFTCMFEEKMHEYEQARMKRRKAG